MEVTANKRRSQPSWERVTRVELAKASQLPTGTKGRPCVYAFPTSLTNQTQEVRAVRHPQEYAALEIDSRLVLRTRRVRHAYQKRSRSLGRAYEEVMHKRTIGRHYCIQIDRETTKSSAVILQFSIVCSTTQICSSPRRTAIVTACVRSLAPNLSTRFLMWKFTVVSAMQS